MTSAARPLTRRRPISERVIETLLFLSAVLGVVTTIGIILVLAVETLGFFGEISPIDFFTGTFWSASIQPRAFGVLALVSGTILVAGIALLIAVPLGLLSRRAARGLRAAAAAHDPQADSRDPRRGPDDRPRLLRHQLRLPAAADPDHRQGAHRRVLGARRRDRGRAADHAVDRVDLRGRHACRPARDARRGLRHGRHQVRGRPQGRLPGRAVGDHGLDHPGHEPGHRRDDGRPAGGGNEAPVHL